MNFLRRYYPILFFAWIPLVLAASLTSPSSPPIPDIECVDVAYEEPSIPAHADKTDYTYQIQNHKLDRYRPYHGLGTNRVLEGDVVIAAFFVDDEESRWTADETAEFTNQCLLPALDFLEQEAERYSVPLDFTVWRYSTAFSEGLTAMSYDGAVIKDLHDSPTGSTKDMMDHVAADLGYASNMALHAALVERADGREVIPLFFVNKEGVSYTRHTISGTAVKYCEQSIIFAYRISSPHRFNAKRTATTVAHEILHFFGAEDYYTPDVRERLASEQAPRDVMLMDYLYLDLLEVDKATAFSIGWTDQVPDLFLEPDWWGEQ